MTVTVFDPHRFTLQQKAKITEASYAAGFAVTFGLTDEGQDFALLYRPECEDVAFGIIKLQDGWLAYDHRGVDVVTTGNPEELVRLLSRC